jgi:pimeloyl-ACP methyl ester carboxylesterase
VDFDTFQAVVNDALSVPLPPIRHTTGQRLRVLIGRHDPYAEAADVDYWHSVFPVATVELVEAGHFPHLELPPECWLPA